MAATETLTVTSEGTTLDLLLWRSYRKAYDGLVERTLDINPGLAAQGQVLAVGTGVLVEVPQPKDQVVLPVVDLWS